MTGPADAPVSGFSELVLNLDACLFAYAGCAEPVKAPRSAVLFLAMLVEKGPLTANVLYSLVCRNAEDSDELEHPHLRADGYCRLQLSRLRAAFRSMGLALPVRRRERGGDAPYCISGSGPAIRVVSFPTPYEERLLSWAIQKYENGRYRGCLDVLRENGVLDNGSYCCRSRAALYALLAVLSLNDMDAAFEYAQDVMRCLLPEQEQRLYDEALQPLLRRKTA